MPRLPPVIPGPSALEELYERLSAMADARHAEWGEPIGEQEHQLRIAKSLTGAALASEFLSSVRTYLSYSNPAGSFYDTREPLSDDHRPTTDEEIKTSSIAWWFEQSPELFGSDGSRIGLRYLDRELVPLRTAGGDKETSAKSRASRRLDLLLVADDGTPVITEVKAKADQNPFYALVQLLMLAAQLSTLHQRVRLNNCYAELRQSAGPADLCLIVAANLRYLYEPPDGWKARRPKFRPALALEAERLSTELLTETQLERYLRRITWLDASIVEGRLTFTRLRAFS
jgi:hypothetical protein